MKKVTITSIAAFMLFVVFTAFAPAGGYQVGESVKDFKLKNVDGKTMSLADNKAAKGFIVVFTCNHCPFSKMYESRIMSLNDMYASKGYPVIAINPNDKNEVPDDSYENMQALAKEKGYKFPYLYDETQEVAAAFGAARTPHVFIVVKEKDKLVLKYIGAIDDNAEDGKMADEKYVENAMNQIIAGKPVTESMTKAVGCTIKWKKS
ncbi:MAG: thioredoxin family protein [Bacteroidia bacterium]